MVGAEVVLGDGRVVEVSDKKKEDLFWGLRGAGHNFGVVSEFVVRVHEVGERAWWAWEAFTFEGKRLEEVYPVLGALMESQPAGVVLWSYWQKVVEVDPVKPVIVVYSLYNGPLEQARGYSRPIRNLNPVAYRSGKTEYPGIQAVMATEKDGPVCEPKGSVIYRGFDVNKYNLTAVRNWFDIFTEKMVTEEAFAQSFCMLEGYSVQGVQAVPADSTAFPHRGQRLLLAPIIIYDIVGNATLDKEAELWGDEMATAAFGGVPRRSYVNYAHGDESLEALYGYESWRQKKLRALKQKYDPENRFRFFNPIVVDGEED